MGEKVRVVVLADDYAGQDSVYWAQHGISLWIEIYAEKGRKVILFDTGSYGELVLRNMKVAGLSPQEIDMIVLSHKHYDHTGGLLPILREAGKELVPVFGHPAASEISFCADDFCESVGMPYPRMLERAADLGGQWMPCASPIQLGPGIFYSGEIPRQTEFEADSAGLFVLRGGKAEREDFIDDVALYLKTDRGLTVISGCAHAGIVNVVRHGLALTGEKRVDAVMGGFHLYAAEAERIEKTADALKQMGVSKLYAGHCTGLKAESYFLNFFGEGFEKLFCGREIIL